MTNDVEQPRGLPIELPAELQAWVIESTGGRIADAERVMGGASREAWLVNVQRDGESITELFLRRDNGTGPMQGTPYTIGREATVYRALASTPVPVPEVIAIHPDGNTVLLERIEGEAYFPAAGDAREQLAEQFVEILAALHTTDVGTLDVPMLVRPRTPEEHATLELDIWEQLQRERGRPDPLVSFTLRWLRARADNRRPHRARAGRHRPRQLHVPRRAHRGRGRLGARAPR